MTSSLTEVTAAPLLPRLPPTDVVTARLLQRIIDLVDQDPC
jgi:hypothetical protein